MLDRLSEQSARWISFAVILAIVDGLFTALFLLMGAMFGEIVLFDLIITFVVGLFLLLPL
jgi:hypothetical protein